MVSNKLISTVNAGTYYEATNQGGARSQIIEGDDGIIYYVKLNRNPQGSRVLINELIANGIAQLLEIPIPKGALINLSQEFLDTNPDLIASFGPSLIPGFHFASEYLKNSYAPEPVSMINSICNKNDLPLIVVFDILMMNNDRNVVNNCRLLSSDGSSKTVKLYILDHGHCFGGPQWDLFIRENVAVWDTNTLNDDIAKLIVGNAPFDNALEKVEKLSNDQISSIIDLLPKEWDVSQEEKKFIKDFLNQRKFLIRNMLADHKNLFPFWIEP